MNKGWNFSKHLTILSLKNEKNIIEIHWLKKLIEVISEKSDISILEPWELWKNIIIEIKSSSKKSFSSIPNHSINHKNFLIDIDFSSKIKSLKSSPPFLKTYQKKKKLM